MPLHNCYVTVVAPGPHRPMLRPRETRARGLGKLGLTGAGGARQAILVFSGWIGLETLDWHTGPVNGKGCSFRHMKLMLAGTISGVVVVNPKIPA